MVSRIAFGLAIRHPKAQHFELFGGEHTLTHEMRVLLIRGLRRHVACGGDVFDELSVRHDFLEGGQMHGTNFTHPMALRAVLVDDGGDVLMERHALRM